MLSEAAEKSSGNTKILGVTVLTSHDKESLTRLGYERQYTNNITSLVLKRALMAREAGCDGVICSGREVKAIKREIGPDFIAMTPGIRPKWSLGAGDDQKRVVTPEDAVRDGADYIVIGRPIRDAPDPADAARKVAEEIASGL